ncbi:MAG: calcium-binding protein [Pseudomonadota bacterium]
MTDIPGDSTTAARLAPGRSLNGQVDFLGDNDWVQVAVTTGASYVFILEPDGSGIRPFLRLYDAVSVLQDSDLGGASARLSYTAQATGHIFLSATSLYASGAIGGYSLQAAAPFRQSADTVPGDSTTPLLLLPGDRIDSAIDDDWVGLSLRAGHSYQIAYSPGETPPEAVSLTLYNVNGNALREMTLSDARSLTVNAWRDGTHYVGLAATDAGSLGDGTLSLIRTSASSYLTIGADTMTGTAGPDRMLAMGGADSLSGLEGNDVFFGGNGNDRIDGGAFNDQLFGGAGLDSLWGGTGRDALFGGSGADMLDGGRATDKLHGGGGGDLLLGGIGDDTIFGQGGADTLFGGPNNDSLVGGRGADTLDGGRGSDRLEGGEGADLFIVVGTADDTITDFTQGEDLIDLSAVALLEDFDDVILWAGELSGNAAIRMGFGALVLEGIALDDLAADDFVF